MDVSSIWAVMLLLFAALLLFAEVFIPSGGIIFALSMCCLGLAGYSAWIAWWEHYPFLWWSFVASVVVLLPSAIAAALYVWPHTPIAKGMEPPTEEEVTPYLAEQKRLEKLLGQIGETVTPQNPGGMTRVAGQRVHSLSEGMIIDQGEPVRILAVRGNRVLVRQVPRGTEQAPTESVPDDAQFGSGGEAALDFDLPA
jgi:membrane-bound ClpP family serine protease